MITIIRVFPVLNQSKCFYYKSYIHICYEKLNLIPETSTYESKSFKFGISRERKLINDVEGKELVYNKIWL